MIRAVLDANILIGGPFSRQGSVQLLHAAFVSDRFHNVSTPGILHEVEHAWQDPYWTKRYSRQQLQSALELIGSLSELIELQSDWFGVAPHRHDDHVLGAAVEGKCDYLVTGDRELQAMRQFRSVVIVGPDELLAALTAP